MAYKNDDQTFIEAIKTSRNPRQALLKLNLNAAGQSYYILLERCGKLNISTSHFLNDKELRKSFTETDVKDSCAKHSSRQSVLRSFNLSPDSGSNVRWIDDQILNYKIDITHWTGQGHLKGKSHDWSKIIPIEEILVEKSKYSTTSLKKRLLSLNLIINKCYDCGTDPIHNGKPLVLQLDHINGNHFDNRIENLRFLCPNCHSQTDTFCSRKLLPGEKKPKLAKNLNQYKRIKTIIINNCLECNKEISEMSKLCKECWDNNRDKYPTDYIQPTKIEWDNTYLLELLQTQTYLAVSKILGVSDSAIRKHLKCMGLNPTEIVRQRRANTKQPAKVTKRAPTQKCLDCYNLIHLNSTRCRSCYEHSKATH